ncbi:MAG: tetratricopeptide repeat protein [Bacteroidales bacterium]|nr:tetratricopeptide repeat protein [Bacteroidales bacterium]
MSQNNQNINPVLQKKQQQNKPNSKGQLAMKYYREKEYQKALELYEQLYTANPSNYYYSYLFNCYNVLKEYKKADRLVRQHRKRNPTNSKYLIDEAYIADLSGNGKKSKKILNKLIDNLPSQRNQIMQITSSLQAKGYANIAVEVYKKASSESGSNYSYGFEIGDAYMYSGNYSLMINSYLNHLILVPTDMQRVKSKLRMVMQMDINSNLTGILKSKLLEYSQNNPDNLQLADMLLWFSMQTKDFDMAFRQARSIDMRFDNAEKNMMELAYIAYSNYNYEVAANAYGYVKNKKVNGQYTTDAWVGYYLAVCMSADENQDTDMSTYEDLEEQGIEAVNELGINNITSDLIVQLSEITAFKLSKYKEAIEMLEIALMNPSLKSKKQAELKIVLADILLADDKIWDATLLYSQVESEMKNEPIGHEAKLKNAKVFYYAGEFDWAATRLDVLKSATSKLISNDAIDLSLFISEMRDEDTLGFTLRKFAGADLYVYQGKLDSALFLLNKIENNPSAYISKEYALFKKAQILVKLGNVKEADSVYNLLISLYPTSFKTDNALYERAELLRTTNNLEEAKKLYLIIMTDYPESIFAAKARKIYRINEENEQLGDKNYILNSDY